jgi:hypothetical protein
MTGRHKLELAETSVLRQETNTTVPRLARSLQDTVKAEMTKRARARRASPKTRSSFQLKERLLPSVTARRRLEGPADRD